MNVPDLVWRLLYPARVSNDDRPGEHAGAWFETGRQYEKQMSE